MATAAGYSEDDLEVLEAEFARLIQASIVKVCDATANELHGAVTADASSAALTTLDVSGVVDAWQAEVDGVLVPYVSEIYTGSAATVAVDVAQAFPDPDLPGVPLVADQFALDFLKQASSGQFAGVGDELWEDVRNELLDGVAQGQSIPQIRDRIRAVANYTERHSALVARTAVHTAAEAGNVAQMQFMGYADDEVEKEWVATLGDGRTRATHIKAHGQTVPLGGKFIVGGWQLDHPGDWTAPGEEIINCRCTTVFNFNDPPKFRCGGAVVAAVDDAEFCVVPVKKPSIAHLLQITPPWSKVTAQLIFNAFMKAKITPAYGGSKIQKTLDATRVAMADSHPGLLDGVSDMEMLAAIDHYYVAVKDTFFDKWVSWAQSPAGIKALGKKPTVPKAMKSPIEITPASPPPPTPAAPAPPKLLGKPSSEKFTILDDPGKSGDGYAPMGQWGKYGSSGVLVRAVDAQGVARFLLIQRGEKYLGSQKFKWQLPGGGLDSKEGPYEGAARELWEETAPPEGFVESMVPLGEMVYDGGGGWKYTTIAAHADSTFKPTVHGSTGDAQWFTLEEIQQMVDDGHIIKELAPTLKQLAAETDELAGVKFVEPPKMPAVAARPEPSDLVFTGKTLGSHGAQVWRNPATGERWLFKPQDDFLIKLDVATARVQSKALATRPGMYEITLNGKHGSIQYMFESVEAFPGGSFDPLKLTPEEIFALQREQILDWMLSNFDTHSGQWIRLADGTLFETDKGQSFKFFGNDKLAWDYVPVTPLGSDRLTYSPLWKAFVQGKDVDLHDPTAGALGEYMARLTAIDDATYRDILRPYALGRYKSDAAVKKFLDDAVARKNSLEADFTAFWQKAVDARKKTLETTPPLTPAPPPPPLPPKPITVPTTVPTPPLGGSLGDISGVSASIKKVISNQWVALGAGKKVTPAWGGAKIYKMLKDMKEWSKGDSELEFLTDLQILRILDDVGGFKGKPKTYESVVADWLATPGSTKVTLKVGMPDASLTPSAVKLPAASPIVPPAATVVDEAAEVLGVGVNADPWELFAALPKYKNGDVVGYMMTKNGDTLRATHTLLSTGQSLIRVELRKSGTDTWVFDQNYANGMALSNHYNATDIWSLKPPPAAVGKSLIPGKMPNDGVGADELWASRYLWKANDVVATASIDTHDYQLISDGKGELFFYIRKKGDSAWVYSSQVSDVDVDGGWATNVSWKLTGDVLKEEKTGAISGKNEGDVITIIDAYQAATEHLDPDVTVYAYAYDPLNNIELRIISDGVGPKLQTRIVGVESTWSKSSLYAPTDLEPYKFLIWRTAKTNGQPPDSHFALIPGQTKIPVKTSSKLGPAAGEEVSSTTIWNTAYAYDDYDIIAFGHNPITYTEYRTYKIDGHLVVEWKSSGGGWQGYDVPKTLGDAEKYPIKWTVASPGMKATPSSLGAKDLKKQVTKKFGPVKKVPAQKSTPAPAVAPSTPPPPAKKLLTGTATHIPEKSVGDAVTQDEILANLDKYVDGQVIATHGGWQNVRIFVLDGHLIRQSQTAAGAWKTDDITKLTSTGLVHHVSKFASWKASNDVITKPQVKAVQKAIAKKYPTASSPVSPSVRKSSKSVSSSPSVVGLPIQQMQHVDITQWTDTEQDEIHAFFRSTNVYTSASPEQIWGRVQAVKSHFQSKYKGKYLNLNEIEILRIVDARRAAKKGIADEHAYETKVVNWLKTPAGKAWVNKRIDAPIAAHDVPMPMMALDDPANPDPDKQSYSVVTLAQARQYREESHKKYGTWRTGEKEAQKAYTGNNYTAWNSAIRSGELGSYRSNIIKAVEGMRPSTRSMILHRGCGFAELNDPSITSYETLLAYVGRTYMNRNFNSTSVGGHAAFGGQLLIEIECPIGTPMTHVADFSHYKSENETLLPPHLIYQILSVTKAPNGYTTVMRVRVIGAAEPNA